MSDSVFWNEGLMLVPQHFQLQDQLMRAYQNATTVMSDPYAWGFSALDLDLSKLADGRVSVIHAEGRLPNGHKFSIPEDAALSAQIDLSDLSSPDRNQHRLHLGMRRLDPYRSQTTWEHDGIHEPAIRSLLRSESVLSEQEPSTPRPITIKRDVLRILSDADPLVEYDSMLLAVVRKEDGRFDVVRDVVGPCLQMSASDRLCRAVETVYSAIVSKLESMVGRRAESIGGSTTVASGDIINVFVQTAMSNAMIALNDAIENTSYHPFYLYRLMSQCYAALCAAKDVLPTRCPYDHANPAESFLFFERNIPPLLTIQRKTWSEIALTQDQNDSRIRSCSEKLPPEAFAAESEFFCAFRSKSESDLRRELELVKISSRSQVESVYSDAKLGLGKTIASRIPAGLPHRDGFHYIKLDRTGTHWKHIEEERSIAFFVPASLDPELTLYFVRESSSA